jgi:hypothetical protein
MAAGNIHKNLCALGGFLKHFQDYGRFSECVFSEKISSLGPQKIFFETIL